MLLDGPDGVFGRSRDSPEGDGRIAACLMGAAAYRRGSNVIARQASDDLEHSGVNERATRTAAADERERLRQRIRQLEFELQRSERARAILRATLTEERKRNAADREEAKRNHLFAVRTLAKRANLDGARDAPRKRRRRP